MAHFLGSMFHWFYCLDLPQAALLLLLAVLLFCGLDTFLRSRSWWRWLVRAIFMLWFALTVYLTVIRREPSDAVPFVHNFIPFHSYREVLAGGTRELLRSNFMNVALFLPAGLLLPFLLPQKWPCWRKILLTVFLAALLSCGIEYLQYTYCLGRSEMDDVLHNAFGALLSAGIYAAVEKLMPKLFKIATDRAA